MEGIRINSVMLVEKQEELRIIIQFEDAEKKYGFNTVIRSQRADLLWELLKQYAGEIIDMERDRRK